MNKYNSHKDMYSVAVILVFFVLLAITLLSGILGGKNKFTIGNKHEKITCKSCKINRMRDMNNQDR